MKKYEPIDLDIIEEPWVLALDMGSSSSRAMVFDAKAQPVPGLEAHRHYDIPFLADGTVETNPDRLLQALFECVDDVVAQAGKHTQKIGAVGSCTFVTSTMGITHDGQPTTPLITYADTRSTQDAAVLEHKFDAAAIHQRTGCRPYPTYFPARYLWIRRTHPDWAENAAHWITIGDYLILRLFGRLITSYSVASWSGLLNVHDLTWDQQTLNTINLDEEQLPNLVDIDTSVGNLKPEFANRWPCLSGIPWYPPIGDGAAANLGSDCYTPKQVAVTIGTTTALRVILTDPPDTIPQGLWCYRVDKKHSLVGGALNEGGNIHAWLLDLLNLSSVSDLEQALSQIKPDGHHLTFLPLLSGERSPGWNPQARGIIDGLSLSTTPAEIVRASLEGICYRVAQVYQQLRSILPTDPEITAGGGAITHSPTWLQILADVLGRPIKLAPILEASARGVAWQALKNLGVHIQKPAASKIYSPDPEAHKIYQQAAQRQYRLYEVHYPRSSD